LDSEKEMNFEGKWIGEIESQGLSPAHPIAREREVE
jgi:hypothetical protein